MDKVKLKIKPTVIAAELDRDPSTIYREVSRHSIDQKDTYLRVSKVYYAETAQMLYEKSRMNYIHIGLSKVKPIDLHLKVRRKRRHHGYG